MPGCRLLLIPIVILVTALSCPTAGTAAAAGRSVPDAFAPPVLPIDLLPVPKEVIWSAGSFAVTPSTRIIVGNSATDEDLYAARELNEELRARYGTTLQVVREREVASPAGYIVLGERGTTVVLDRLGLPATPKPLGPEGYMLRVTRANIVVAGSDRRGTFYGVQTLRQLLRPGGAGAVVRAVTIRDWPDHPVRAVHVLLDGDSPELHGALIERILAPYKFNTLVAEAESVQWESGRPFWSPDPRGITKAQVRQLLEVARRHHVQVIPLIATLGHSEWVFAGLGDEELCGQIAYLPRRLREDDKTAVTCDHGRGVFPAVYDPQHPIAVEGKAKTVNGALIIPILQEAIDLFRPAYLHLGHDEVRGPSGLRHDMGLYLRDIVTLSQVLKASRVTPMVWGDVLWDRRDEAAADPQSKDLPRDMVIVPWKYEDTREYPELSYFRQAGFPVMGATWWRVYNNHFMSRVAKAAGALGMVRTTWTGQFQNRAALTRAYRQLYTYLTAASYFWTADRPRPERAPSEAALARRFADAWNPPPARRPPIAGALLDLSPVATQPHIDTDGTGWLGKGPEFDLRALRPGRIRLDGILFDILDPAAHGGKSVVMLEGERDGAAAMPPQVTLPVGRQAGCLAFLHTAVDRAPSFGDVIGRYTITLAGGQTITVDLAYGRDISSWLWDAERGIPSIDLEVAWTGATAAGTDVNLQVWRWKNPQPALPIESIELASSGGRSSPVVVAITALDRCP